MAKKKINDDTLIQLIRDGNSPVEAARRLGVGRAAVSKRLKALKIGVARDVTLRRRPNLSTRGMDAMAQLRKINDSVNAELDPIEEGQAVSRARIRKDSRRKESDTLLKFASR